MYYLNLDGLQLAGSSPEMLSKLTGSRVVTRPLAGTRPRGDSESEDRELARSLLADAKERAEHVMLVDLSRNDLGRVCRTGSIRVERHLEIERYARVMHLVSDVVGRIRDDRDAFDLFESTFPAGTVSGAPKIRAMQIIEELESVRRGPYAGAIGYFSFLGDMDLCIAIRTIVVAGGRGYLQAGAGVVADSVPELEYEETLNKARALIQALALSSARV
jgi:anthranilate synthase component 1